MRKIFVEGHRGYCAKYPENTLISFEGAMDLGVDGFEFDIWLSSDKVPVLMHDGNCRRTCGVDRHLRDMTLAEIRTLDAGYRQKFGEKYMGKGIGVPTLEEALRLTAEKCPGIPLGVEIKEYTEETVDLSVPLLKEYGLFDNSIFYAFDAKTIKYLKTKYGARTMGYPDFQMKRFEAGDYRYYDDIGLNMNLVRSEIFGFYPKKGLPLHMYCADNDVDVATCFARQDELGGDHVLITANDPVPLMKALGRPIGNTKDI